MGQWGARRHPSMGQGVWLRVTLSPPEFPAAVHDTASLRLQPIKVLYSTAIPSDHKSAKELLRVAADDLERKEVNLSKSGLSHIPHYWPNAGGSDLRQMLVVLDLSNNQLTSLETLSAAPQSPGQIKGTLGAVR